MIGYRAGAGLSTSYAPGLPFPWVSILVGIPRGMNECRNLRGILATGRRLNAAGDVDHPRLNPGDFRRHVFRCETTSQDEPGKGGYAIEHIAANTRAGASQLAGNLGIDQNRVGHSTQGVCPRDIVDHHRPVRGLAQPKCPDEFDMTKRDEIFRRFLAVKLDYLETKFVRNMSHFGRGPIDKDAHDRHRGRKSSDDRLGSIQVTKRGERA